MLQGDKPKNVSSLQKLKKTKKQILAQNLSVRNTALPIHLKLYLTSKTVQQQITIVLSHKIVVICCSRKRKRIHHILNWAVTAVRKKRDQYLLNREGIRGRRDMGKVISAGDYLYLHVTKSYNNDVNKSSRILFSHHKKSESGQARLVR